MSTGARRGAIDRLIMADGVHTHHCFIRWRDKGISEKLLETLIDEPDYEWLMIDANHCNSTLMQRAQEAGARTCSRTKGGSTTRYIWPWMRWVDRSESLSQKVPERIARRLDV